MVESRDSRTVTLTDGVFISHQTTIVDSFYCIVYIILFKVMHNNYANIINITLKIALFSVIESAVRIQAGNLQFLTKVGALSTG